MAKHGASAIPDVDAMAFDRALSFTLPAARRAALVGRLAQKGVPTDAADLIADTVQAQCRAHLARLVCMPANMRKPRIFPDADTIADALADDRAQLERIQSLAAELAGALRELTAGMENSALNLAARFAVALAWQARRPTAGETDGQWQELYARAPAALEAIGAALADIEAAAAFMMPPPIDPGKRGHELTRLVIAIRAHLDWALPAESAARRAHERTPSGAKSPLAQCLGIAIDAMRAAGHDIPEHTDLRGLIEPILANYAKGEADLAAQFGQNGASRAG